MIDYCLFCGKEADYIRHTQFAGDHPFCAQHAEAEDDFMSNDSYTGWSKI